MNGEPLPLTNDSQTEDPVYAEIRDAILRDTTALGDIFRRTEQGETPDQIRIARGNERATFVWNYLRMAKAILEDDIPDAVSVAVQAKRALQRLFRENEFSAEAGAVLERRLSALEERASDPVLLAKEEKEAKSKTAEAEKKDIPGVYVYSLPHYMRYRFDPETGRTLMKVGHSNRSAIQRFRDQKRTTALPEDPLLLRVYECSDAESADQEGKFHRLMEAAGHDRSTARAGGTEWFLTSLRFLDEIAAVIGLKVQVVSLPDAS